ncbi:Tn3 family transposase [Streptomyces sp. MS1.HAVA.3]|uniref:Tn3 family transposase n=1 Tax=Streptomyces caledonius TaxID=3134107 RepID=A0ABU8TY77_9ACTN
MRRWPGTGWGPRPRAWSGPRPELLFEVHGWTGFLDAFVHLGDGTTRMKDLTTSLVALLVSEACIIGMTPVINPHMRPPTADLPGGAGDPPPRHPPCAEAGPGCEAGTSLPGFYILNSESDLPSGTNTCNHLLDCA